MDVSPYSRKRAVLQLHQEAQCQPPACKRRCRDEEEMKSRRRRMDGGCEENIDLGECLQRNTRIQNLNKEHRRFPQSGLQTRTKVRTGCAIGSGFTSGVVTQSCRPEIKVARIRKTRIKTSVRTAELRGSKLDKGYMDQAGPGSTETQLDQRRRTQFRSRSTAGLVSDQFPEARSRRSERDQNQESCRGEGAPQRIRSKSGGATETRTRKRRKIHPSLFRDRGQLRLSITPEAGKLKIYIHEARGLMGKSQQSCDSYVKLVVTPHIDYSTRMKTQTVWNNKNPEYNHSSILCTSDDLIRSRLLISVFSRCRQLIGCMSFGIGSLVSSSKPVTGWFYLLGEEFGQSKHLRVTSQRNKPIRSQENVDVPTHCGVHMVTMVMRSCTVTM